MKQAQTTITIKTNGQGLVEMTDVVVSWVSAQKIGVGLLTVFCRHTSASLTIQENADPDVQRDLEDFFSRTVPEGRDLYRHSSEGPDDMPAHIRGALTDTALSIPVADGRPRLGTWQGVFLFEHRRHSHRREVVLHLVGE